MSLKNDMATLGKAALTGAIAFGIVAAPAQALTKSQINELSYLQVKGTGLANRCADKTLQTYWESSNHSGRHPPDACANPIKRP
jgi:hypothetical protein